MTYVREAGETRPCNGCTMCCKLLSIADVQSPVNEWCTHCVIGKGCSEWDRLSELSPSCIGFNCLWQSLDLNWPESERPDRSKVVFSVFGQPRSLLVSVDPSRPDAWRRPFQQGVINSCIRNGMKAYVICGDRHLFCGDASALTKGMVEMRGEA